MSVWFPIGEGTLTWEIRPLFEYLEPLNEAVAEIANTWRPDDPEYRADVYRQIMMQFSYGYFAFFHADAEHPDWAPLWNPVYTLQPNPDDIYLYCPIEQRLPVPDHWQPGHGENVDPLTPS